MAGVDHLFPLSPENGGTKVERVITVVKAPFLSKLLLAIAGLLFAGARNTKSLTQLEQRLEQGTS